MIEQGDADAAVIALRDHLEGSVALMTSVFLESQASLATNGLPELPTAAGNQTMTLAHRD